MVNAEIVDSRMWICLCCYMVHCNGECCSDDSHGGDSVEPLNLIEYPYTITAGLLWSEHDSECPNRAANASVEECDCETNTFSKSRCEGCGSHLYGERHAATLWKENDSARA